MPTMTDSSSAAPLAKRVYVSNMGRKGGRNTGLSNFSKEQTMGIKIKVPKVKVPKVKVSTPRKIKFKKVKI